MFGDLVVPVDSSSITLGMGLSITLKSCGEVAWVAGGDRSLVVRVPAARAGRPVFDSSGCPGFDSRCLLFFVNGRFCGALVLFGCYQHGRK